MWHFRTFHVTFFTFTWVTVVSIVSCDISNGAVSFLSRVTSLPWQSDRRWRRRLTSDSVTELSRSTSAEHGAERTPTLEAATQKNRRRNVTHLCQIFDSLAAKWKILSLVCVTFWVPVSLHRRLLCLRHVTRDRSYLKGFGARDAQSRGSSTVQRLHHHLHRNTDLKSTDSTPGDRRRQVLPGRCCRSGDWCGWRHRGSRRASVETWKSLHFRDSSYSDVTAHFVHNITSWFMLSWRCWVSRYQIIDLD